MESVSVERLDHLGVVASVIKTFDIIEMIDARLLRHDQEEITAGEAVAGMILNGLGFSNSALSLPPQFFEIGRRRVGKECRSRWSPYH